jgi:predicted esterase
MARDTIFETISAATHGRYILDLPDGDGPFPLLVGFHGYAQHAEAMLEVLRRVPKTEGWVRASVQGLHTFYAGRTQEVVSSWMTRLNRELGINDNIAYIRSVIGALRNDYPIDETLVFCGFSQGAAMAYRAAAAIRCNGVVVNGGDAPPDVLTREKLRLPNVLISRGSGDEWYTAEKMESDTAKLRERGVIVETLQFDGGHECSDAFVKAAGAFIGNVPRGEEAHR